MYSHSYVVCLPETQPSLPNTCVLFTRQKLLPRCHMTTPAPQVQNFLSFPCFSYPPVAQVRTVICGIFHLPPLPLQHLIMREAVPILLRYFSSLPPPPSLLGAQDAFNEGSNYSDDDFITNYLLQVINVFSTFLDSFF